MCFYCLYDNQEQIPTHIQISRQTRRSNWGNIEIDED